MKWGSDKDKHLIVSFLLVVILYIITRSGLLSMSIALGVGILKEVYDQWKYGGFDVADLAADIIGILIGGFICSLI